MRKKNYYKNKKKTPKIKLKYNKNADKKFLNGNKIKKKN